jgi:predicted PurR-regulated permease PerM
MSSPGNLRRRWAWGIGVFAVVLVAAWRLENLATLLILSFLLAYVLNPLVTRLAKLRFVNRTAAAFITLFGLLICFLAILLIIVPEVVGEFQQFISRLPGYLTRAKGAMVPWVRDELGLVMPLSVAEAVDQFGEDLNNMAPRIIGTATQIAARLFGGTFSVVAKAAAVVMFPFFLFFLVKDFPRITAAVKELIPPRNKANVLILSERIDKSVSAFLHGQFIVMLVLGTLYSIGYSVVGIPVALGLGLFTGILCFIPYVGPATGFLLALLMSLIEYQGAGTVLGVIVVFASVQLLDAVLITPKIIGGQLGLSPLWIVVALMAGGELFGFLGVLLAVPATAVLKVLVGHTVERYKHSVLYRDSIMPVSPRPSADRDAGAEDDSR